MKPGFIDGESELAKRCGITDLWEGQTTTESRRERLRVAVMTLDPAIAWRGPTGKPETFAEAFTRTYGEPP